MAVPSLLESTPLSRESSAVQREMSSFSPILDAKAALHAVGVNLRYLGLVRRYSQVPAVRTCLMVEMLARSIKHILRKKMRSLMRKLKAPVSSPVRVMVIAILNMVFGTSEESTRFWNTKLKNELLFNFPQSLVKAERSPDFDLKTIIDKSDLIALFVVVVRQGEIKLREKCLQEFSSDPQLFAYPQPFDETDLEEIGVVVHHMNIMALAQGYVLKNKGREAPPHAAKTKARLYKMALDRFEEAIWANPSDNKALAEMADTAALLKNKELADAYYLKLLGKNFGDASTLFRYATFLESFDLLAEAEEFYLQSLEADPTNDHCHQRYGSFLDARGDHETAERFFYRASELRKLKCDLLTATQRKRGNTLAAPPTPLFSGLVSSDPSSDLAFSPSSSSSRP